MVPFRVEEEIREQITAKLLPVKPGSYWLIFHEENDEGWLFFEVKLPKEKIGVEKRLYVVARK